MHSFFRPTAEILADARARQAAATARAARVAAEVALESDADLTAALAPLDARVQETDEDLLARMLATTDPTQLARARAGLLPNPTAAAVPAIIVDGRSF